MPLWQNKEDYETWKTEKSEQAKRTAEELEIKRLRKKKLFVCRYCLKEVRRTFLNSIRCPFCKNENPAPPLTKRDQYEGLFAIIAFVIALVIALILLDESMIPTDRAWKMTYDLFFKK